MEKFRERFMGKLTEIQRRIYVKKAMREIFSLWFCFSLKNSTEDVAEEDGERENKIFEFYLFLGIYFVCGLNIEIQEIKRAGDEHKENGFREGSTLCLLLTSPVFVTK